jgi:hypothetical protein
VLVAAALSLTILPRIVLPGKPRTADDPLLTGDPAEGTVLGEGTQKPDEGPVLVR